MTKHTKFHVNQHDYVCKKLLIFSINQVNQSVSEIYRSLLSTQFVLPFSNHIMCNQTVHKPSFLVSWNSSYYSIPVQNWT